MSSFRKKWAPHFVMLASVAILLEIVLNQIYWAMFSSVPLMIEDDFSRALGGVLIAVFMGITMGANITLRRANVKGLFNK